MALKNSGNNQHSLILATLSVFCTFECPTLISNHKWLLSGIIMALQNSGNNQRWRPNKVRSTLLFETNFPEGTVWYLEFFPVFQSFVAYNSTHSIYIRTVLQRICYSHWANGDRNGVISIGQWGVFNHEKGAIWQSHLAAQKEGVVTAIIFSNHKTY